MKFEIRHVRNGAVLRVKRETPAEEVEEIGIGVTSEYSMRFTANLNHVFHDLRGRSPHCH